MALLATDEAIKTCAKCRENKPVSEFYKNRTTKDGLQPWCKECKREYDRSPQGRATQRRIRLSESYKSAQRRAALKYSATPAGKAVRRRSNRRYRSTATGMTAQMSANKRYKLRNPDKILAVSIANRAIATGRLIPQPCEGCGESPVGCDGRRMVHGHHDDYSKPLDVRWLCYLCHRRHHLENQHG